MDRADSLMETASDSAREIIMSIDTAELRTKRMKARYSVLNAMAIDKSGIDTTALKVIAPAVVYYNNHGNADEKLRTYYYLGRIYQNNEEPDIAINTFLKGRDLRLEITDSLTLARLLYTYAGLLHSSRQTDKMTTAACEAANIFQVKQRYPSAFTSLLLALDGYILSGERSGADSIMKLCLELIHRTDGLDSLKLMPYKLTYAITFLPKQEIGKTIPDTAIIKDADPVLQLDVVYAYLESKTFIRQSNYWKQSRSPLTLVTN